MRNVRQTQTQTQTKHRTQRVFTLCSLLVLLAQLARRCACTARPHPPLFFCGACVSVAVLSMLQAPLYIHIHMRHERVCHIRINKDLSRFKFQAPPRKPKAESFQFPTKANSYVECAITQRAPQIPPAPLVLCVVARVILLFS